MGMFDSVWTKCPKCNEEVEFQSKAGECSLRNFRSSSVPENIAQDLDMTIEQCPSCGAAVVLKYGGKPKSVRMQVEILDTEGADFESDDSL